MKELCNIILGAVVIMATFTGLTAVFWVTGDAILGDHMESFP